MDITELTFRLFVIFFPGILAHLIVDALTEHKQRTSFQVLLYSFVLGIGSYFTLWIVSLVLKGISCPLPFDAKIFTTLTEGVPTITFGEFFGAIIVAMFLSAFIIPLGINKKWLHTLARLVRVSEKFGDLDVWSFTFNSKDGEWIIVRDLKYNLYYKGWVRAFSPTFKENEILLQDVEVFKNDTGEKLYSVGALYLSRDSNDLTIELDIPFTEFIKPSEEGEKGDGRQGENKQGD